MGQRGKNSKIETITGWRFFCQVSSRVIWRVLDGNAGQEVNSMADLVGVVSACHVGATG